MRFQYHTGSIQTMKDCYVECEFMDYFNTTLVLFKLAWSLKEHVEMLKFQYHTGSIQTARVIRNTPYIFSFQYHTGSIQTFFFFSIISKILYISIPHWFYSNTHSQSMRGQSMNFNTTLVLFKHSFAEYERAINEFQYHTGSIQTLYCIFFFSL